jgi:hypothetical protein
VPGEHPGGLIGKVTPGKVNRRNQGESGEKKKEKIPEKGKRKVMDSRHKDLPAGD